MQFFISSKGGICTPDRGPKAQAIQLSRLKKKISALSNVEDFLALIEELWKKCKFPAENVKTKMTESKRTSKDPNAPKRARNAFMFMSDEYRESLKKERPDLVGAEIIRELGRIWREDFGSEDKEPFEALAAFDKARYEAEVQTYEETGRIAPTVSPRKVRSKRITKTEIHVPGEMSMNDPVENAPSDHSQLTIERSDSQETVVNEEAFQVQEETNSQDTLVAGESIPSDGEDLIDEGSEDPSNLSLPTLKRVDSQETVVDVETTHSIDSQETVVDVETTPTIDSQETVAEESILSDGEDLIDEDPDSYDPEGSPMPYRQRLIEFLTLVGGPVSEVDEILGKYSSGEEMFAALEKQYGDAYSKAEANKNEPPKATRKVRKLPEFIPARSGARARVSKSEKDTKVPLEEPLEDLLEKIAPKKVTKTDMRKAEAAYRKQIGSKIKQDEPSLDRSTLNTVLKEGWTQLTQEAKLAFLD